MTPALLVATATFALVCGAALMAWPLHAVRPELVEGRADSDALGARASTSSAQTESNQAALYRRRILGAMIVGASLFLGGFTLAWELAR